MQLRGGLASNHPLALLLSDVIVQRGQPEIGQDELPLVRVLWRVAPAASVAMGVLGQGAGVRGGAICERAVCKGAAVGSCCGWPLVLVGMGAVGAEGTGTTKGPWCAGPWASLCWWLLLGVLAHHSGDLAISAPSSDGVRELASFQ